MEKYSGLECDKISGKMKVVAQLKNSLEQLQSTLERALNIAEEAQGQAEEVEQPIGAIAYGLQKSVIPELKKFLGRANVRKSIPRKIELIEGELG